MATPRELISRLWASLRPWRDDRDLEQELRLHLDLAEAEDARRGAASGVDARRAAAIRNGGLAQAMEALRDQRGLPWLENLARDVRHGCRALRRNPGFVIVSAVSLAIGIGANCAVFSWADALLLRPLPVPRARDVLTVGSTDIYGSHVASYRDYADIRDRSSSFQGLAAFVSSTVGFAVDPDQSPTLAMGALVSGNFFTVMDVAPTLGRTFRPEEDQVPGRDAVVILGHEFWKQRFGASRDVLGRPVRLNGVQFTIVGVAPEGFDGPEQWSRFEFYVPIMMWPRLMETPAAPVTAGGAGSAATPDSNLGPLEARDFRRLTIKGRLELGVTMAQAQSELAVIGRDLERDHPATNRNQRLTVRTELQARIAEAPPSAMLIAMLTTLAVAVLFVACANVAGLLASRAPVRAREMAVKLAIGAGRRRLLRQLVIENLLVAGSGGALGLLVGYAGVALFSQFRFPTDLPIAPSFELNRRALVFSLLVSLVSAVLFGLAPAIRATRADLTAVMKATDAAVRGRRRQWGRASLVGGQVAVSVVLLFLATFIYRGFLDLVASGPGYRTDHVLTMSFDPSLAGYSSAQAQRFYEQVAARARLVPGVRSAALASFAPMNGFESVTIVPEGFQFPTGTESATVPGSIVDEHYFTTLGPAILRGRSFHAADTAGAPRVAVVNEHLASVYWPGQDPLGKSFRLNDGHGPRVEVVGVARTAKYQFLVQPPREWVYLPYPQHPKPRMVLLAESEGDPTSLAAPLREMVRGIDASQPVYDVRTMDEVYRLRAVVIFQIIIGLVGAMGAMGLGLAIVGLYGLVAYAASRRTREIGIRMAIGADRLDVLRMVLRQGALLAIVGLIAGLLASAGAQRAMAAAFPGGPSGGQIDLLAFLLVAPAVLAVTLIAAYVPARRAASVNPTEALRCE